MAVMLIALKQSWYLSEKHVKIHVICVIFMQFYGIRSCTVLRAADLGYTGFPTSRFAPPARIDPKSTTSVTQGPTNLLVYVDICSYAVLLRISKFVCLKNCGRGFFLTNIKSVLRWNMGMASWIHHWKYGFWEWKYFDLIAQDFNVKVLACLKFNDFMNGNNYYFDATKLTDTRKQIKLIWLKNWTKKKNWSRS